MSVVVQGRSGSQAELAFSVQGLPYDYDWDPGEGPAKLLIRVPGGEYEPADFTRIVPCDDGEDFGDFVYECDGDENGDLGVIMLRTQVGGGYQEWAQGYVVMPDPLTSEDVPGIADEVDAVLSDAHGVGSWVDTGPGASTNRVLIDTEGYFTFHLSPFLCAITSPDDFYAEIRAPGEDEFVEDETIVFTEILDDEDGCVLAFILPSTYASVAGIGQIRILYGSPSESSLATTIDYEVYEAESEICNANVVQWQYEPVKTLTDDGNVAVTVIQVGDETTGLLNWFGMYHLEMEVTAATATTISLATGGGLAADFLEDVYINVVSGTGQGQERYLRTSSTGNPTVCTIDKAWVVVPDATSKVQLRFGRRSSIQAEELTASRFATDALEAIRDTILDYAHDVGVTLRGMFTRMEAFMTGKAEKMNGKRGGTVLTRFLKRDGVTAAFEGYTDPDTGDRTISDVSGSEPGSEP